MNAWTIYWVMQLDSINSGVALLTFFGCLACPFLWLYVLEETEGLGARVLATFASFFAAVLVALAILLPSSKTAAAMVILPAIANNEQVQKEAGDLYALAKQAQTNLAKPEGKPK